MPTERSGIVFFELDEKWEDHPACALLKEVSLGDVRFPFGFFIADKDGRKCVIPGTKDDLLKTLRTVFPDYPESMAGHCAETAFGQRCQGSCPHFYACMRMVDVASHFFGCSCVDIS
jgi:hypothetical protein